MAVINLKTRKLALNVRRLRRELERRQLEVDQRWYDVLNVVDLELLAYEYDVETPSPRALEVAQLMEKLMADGVSTPADLKRALYGDEIKPVIQAPIVQPMPQEPMPAIEPEPLPTVQPQAVTPAGLIRAKFTGKLAPGSASVPTTEGLKPLNPGEIYLFETTIFGRVKSMWPGWWEQV